MAYTSLNDKNILFLQGTQDSLNSLIAKGEAKEGAFYLTSDTHRLYVGRKNDSNNKIYPVAVNEGVMTVESIDQLKALNGINAGEFYYVTNSNVLCIYNGSEFVQINPDNNTINDNLSNSITAENNVAIIETAVTDTDSKTVSDTFQIKDSSGHTLITAKNEGTNEDPKYVLDLKADEYTLKSSVDTVDSVTAATINLNSANTNQDSNVKITAGENISIVSNGNNNFKISSSYENTVIKPDSDNVDETGVVLSLDNTTGEVKIVITDSDSEQHTGKTAPITYKVGSVDYIPGNTLPVYTKNEIDSIINGINGMTYMGTVGATKVLPTSNVKTGDTYLVNKDDTISVLANQSYDGKAINAKKGDLLIATGEEENGFIKDGALKWSHVPAGDDAESDTQYSWENNVVSNKKILQADGTADSGSWQLVAGGNKAIVITSEALEENNTIDMVTTIEHADLHKFDDGISSLPATFGVTQNSVTALTVVSDVKVNEQGHVTRFDTTTYNLQDTTYTLSGASVEAVEKGVKITDTLTGSDSAVSNSNVTITSDTLAMTVGTVANNPSYSIDLKWGSF